MCMYALSIEPSGGDGVGAVLCAPGPLGSEMSYPEALPQRLLQS
jgi:hypothetical protein